MCSDSLFGVFILGDNDQYSVFNLCCVIVYIQYVGVCR